MKWCREPRCSCRVRPACPGTLVWFPCCPRNSQESSPALWFRSINCLALSLLCGPTLTSVHDYWKTIALTIWIFVGRVMSLHFNTLSRFFIAFLPRSKCVLISWPLDVVAQSLRHIWLFASSWTAACQASLFSTISWSLFKFPCIELVMPSNHHSILASNFFLLLLLLFPCLVLIPG